MTPVLATALRYALVPVVFTVVGAAAGAYWPGLARLRSLVLHLAAGVVFAVVAVELVPEIQRRAAVGGAPVRDVVLGFALGIGTMLGVDRILYRIRGEDDTRGDAPGMSGERTQTGGIPIGPATAEPRHRAVPVSLLVAVGIDFLLDGLLLGVGFAAGARIGILLALAEAAEQLSVGLALAGELTRAGLGRLRVLLLVSALGLLVFLTAVLGATTLSGLPGGTMEVVLSFGVAALLYLVVEELLREAHEEPETTLGTLMFFVGFLAFLVVGMTLE